MFDLSSIIYNTKQFTKAILRQAPIGCICKKETIQFYCLPGDTWRCIVCKKNQPICIMIRENGDNVCNNCVSSFYKPPRYDGWEKDREGWVMFCDTLFILRVIPEGTQWLAKLQTYCTVHPLGFYKSANDAKAFAIKDLLQRIDALTPFLREPK
jgi:hypothetical protein